MLATLPSAPKPPWWTPVGIKQRCGLVLANPQGYLPDSDLVAPAWRLTAHAFELERQDLEAAKAYETAAGYELDRAQCAALQNRAAELRSNSDEATSGKAPARRQRKSEDLAKDEEWTLV